MWVYLFRHGPAGARDPQRWPDDALRPLTLRGVRRTERAARGLGRLERREISLLTSPLQRATQTARILEQILLLAGPVQVAEELLPGAPIAKLMARLKRMASTATVVLVGHEPDLGVLAAAMIQGNPQRPIPLKKAGCCAIVFDGDVRPGEGRLAWLLPPRVLRRVSGKAARP